MPDMDYKPPEPSSMLEAVDGDEDSIGDARDNVDEDALGLEVLPTEFPPSNTV